MSTRTARGRHLLQRRRQHFIPSLIVRWAFMIFVLFDSERDESGSQREDPWAGFGMHLGLHVIVGFSSSEDITVELATFIKKAENLTRRFDYQEAKMSARKQDDCFPLHQMLNTTFAATLSDENMKEVNRVSWFCPKMHMKTDEVVEEVPTYTVDTEQFEKILEECAESKTCNDNNEKNSDVTDKETTETSKYLAVVAPNPNQPDDDETENQENVDKINLEHESIPPETNVDHFQEGSVVIKAEQKPSEVPRKEKFSLFKRIFRRKKNDVMKIHDK
ncbi:hypothetical protein HNY73_002643 [Argiope bruennichi]|uniref:Uncharacterized protein n=1 Tax=Argiope bruennichi TaxID=94029 RepID=A0A8T0FVG5_ARGBR|nr:hypothetical protein HNY73_002643 [Argiope bruennichi]